MSMRLTSSISMCVLGEAVDNGVDCFLEDGLGPRVGHRTRHWPTARGNGGCGLRLRPRHVRRHADTTHSLSIQIKHTAHQYTNYYPVNGTNTRETHKTIPFAFTSFQKERAKARNTRGTADATFVSAACCFSPGWTNFPCDQIGGAPRKYFLLLLFKGERTGAWELANDRFLWRIK